MIALHDRPTQPVPRPRRASVGRARAAHKTLSLSRATARPAPDGLPNLPRGTAKSSPDGLLTFPGGAARPLPAGLFDVLDFQLPAALEAREPPEARGLARDAVRLLVTYRDTDRVVHARFADLPDFLAAGDLVVVNDSATLPAALMAHTADGTAMPLHLSTRLPADLSVVEPRGATVAPLDVLALPGGAAATLLAPYRGSRRLWVARLDLPEPFVPYLQRWGRPIAYPYVRGTWPIEAYQTVYAAEPGSAEMPSAGRAFSAAVLARLRARGVGVAALTLHTGVASLEHDEPPYEEAYQVPAETADAVEATRAAGGRVVAVGTTVVRALESAADARGRVIASRGWTDLVITPERGVRVVDALLTGFHEPRASHLAMLEAIAGRPHLAIAYEAALGGRYLWHEFGDLHLIISERPGPRRGRRQPSPRGPRRSCESAPARRSDSRAACRSLRGVVHARRPGKV